MLQHQPSNRQQVQAGGFTLVELMITVAVIGILALIAAPSMSAMIENSRIVSQGEELVATLQLARAEAVRRNSRVTVCRSTDGSSCASGTSWSGWVVHGIDRTSCTNPDNASSCSDDVIRAYTANSATTVTGPANDIVFKPSGLIDSGTAQTVQVALGSQQRCLTVLISGAVSVTKVAC